MFDSVFYIQGDLVLVPVDRQDRGWYSCSAYSLAGSRNTEPVLLTIIGKYMAIIIVWLAY